MLLWVSLWAIVLHKTTYLHTVWKTRNSANLVFSLTFLSLKFMRKPQNLVKINLFLQPEWFWKHKFCIKLALAGFQPSETNKVAPETNFPCWRFLYVCQIYNRLEYFWQKLFQSLWIFLIGIFRKIFGLYRLRSLINCNVFLIRSMENATKAQF